MDRLPRLYPNPDDLLATMPEELVPLLLAFAREAQKAQNGMFDPNFVNQFAMGDANIVADRSRYAPYHRQKIENHLNETWAIISAERLMIPAPGINGNNGFRVFTKRGEEVANGSIEFQRLREAAAFPKFLLHPSIGDKVHRALMRNDLADAVFTAFRAVEEAVRDAGGYTASDIGVPLMRKAFDKHSGPLTDSTQPEAEREALAHLFAGAIGSYKNPHSHRTVNLVDMRDAQEQVLLASHLLRIVDARRKI